MSGKFRLLLYSILVFLFTASSNVCAQKNIVDVDQTIVQTAAIIDQKLIKYFAEDFMIPEVNIKKMVVYDLSGDGFGLYDIARTYPGGKFYLLTPSIKAQEIMNKWSFGDNVKFTANSNDPPELFENSPDSVRAMAGIFSALLRGLRRNYKGDPIKLHLEKNDDVTTVEMWRFQKELMKYTPPPVNRVPEKVPVMRLIYLEKTVTDSVYTNGKGEKPWKK